MADIFNFTDTWNNAGTQFFGIKLNVTTTAHASNSLLMDLQDGGTSRFAVGHGGGVYLGSNGFVHFGITAGSGGQEAGGNNNGVGGVNGAIYITANGANVFKIVGGGLGLKSNSFLGWTDSIAGADAGNLETGWFRDAADQISQRRSTNAQTYRIYNTYTDGSNYERVDLRWDTNIFAILSSAAGTGTTRSIRFGFGGGTWEINNGNGDWLALSDNTQDIGASGANRPRNIYAGGSIVSGAFVEAATSGAFVFNSRSFIYSPANGNILLQNNANNDFGLLQLGGTTSSFPALKRNSAILEARLADDSTYASFRGGTIAAMSDVYEFGSSGISIRTGTGSPEGVVTAPTGSLYLNLSGGTDTTLYTKNSGSGNTGWIAVDNV